MFLLPLLLAVAGIPSQVDAQKLFDNAVARSDRVRIEYIQFRPKEQTFICELSEREEIDALSSFIQLRIDPPAKKIVDGREILVQQMPGRVDAPGCFYLVMEDKHHTTISIAIYDDDLVGIAEIVKDSTIKADKKALSPFWNRLLKSLLQKKANQSLEPTSVLGTSAAEPPRVPSTLVAHL